MFYTELIKQAAEAAGVADMYSAMTAEQSQNAFEILRLSLLALNSDSRLTFAVEDMQIDLRSPKLVLTPDSGYEAGEGERVLKTDWPVEVAPAYVIGSQNVKFEHVQREDFFTTRRFSPFVYALRIEFGKASLFFNYAGTVKIGLRKPLAMPEQLTDEAKLTGSVANLLKYKLAMELCVSNHLEAGRELEQAYSEQIARHAQAKESMAPPPKLTNRRY